MVYLFSPCIYFFMIVGQRVLNEFMLEFGGHWRVRGGCTFPDGANMFSLDLLLKTHLGGNNAAKFTQFGDNWQDNGAKCGKL